MAKTKPSKELEDACLRAFYSTHQVIGSEFGPMGLMIAAPDCEPVLLEAREVFMDYGEFKRWWLEGSSSPVAVSWRGARDAPPAPRQLSLWAAR